jgi:hypothetical protein
LPTKVLQADRNILAEACGRRSASGHLGVTRVDRAALFDALCRRDARRGDGAASDLVPGPQSSRTHGDWITEKEHEAVRALSRSAHQLRDSSWLEPRGSIRFYPCRDTPSARGAVCKTVATGCAGRLLVSAPPATRGRSSAGRARRWQCRRRGFDLRRLHQHPPCPCSSGDRAPACEAGGRRFKSSRGHQDVHPCG